MTLSVSGVLVDDAGDGRSISQGLKIVPQKPLDGVTDTWKNTACGKESCFRWAEEETLDNSQTMMVRPLSD